MEMNENLELGETSDEELSGDYEKMRIECICPKCGKRHMMQFHWSGTGTPRKYCKKCKSSF
jgi:ribosomal protein S27AE